MRIQDKIVAPYTVLFIVAALTTALVSINLMSRNLEARLENQINEASRMVARSEFAMNLSILANLKSILDADIVTFARDGTVLASTLPEGDSELLDMVRREDLPGALSENKEAFALREIQFRGSPYKVAYRPLFIRSDAMIAVLTSTSDLAETQRVIARGVLLIVAAIIALMTLIGHWIARSVTSPIQRLVQFTKQVAEGDRARRAPADSRDEVGELARAFNEMVDRLKASEDKLLQSEKLAVTGLLAARVAHDVRNPLAAIKMQAQLLRARLQPGADNAALLDAILREIDRVEWVVQGLLDLSTPRKLELQRGRVETVLEDILQQSDLQFRHRKIFVERHYDSSAPEMRLDPNRLKLAFMNLIFNAAEAMPNGGTLGVRTRRDDQRVVVEISDDGVGIDPSVRDRLFDPFVTTKREGVGLGLVNSKTIVERHGGTMELRSRDAKGTCALVYLPISGPQGTEDVEVAEAARR